VRFDPHGEGGDPNSYFHSPTGHVSFGDTGVDHAEDALGVLIHQINLIGKGAGAIYTLDVSAYPPGVYEVAIEGAEDGNTLRARFVKQCE
jgi:hypothetical protein